MILTHEFNLTFHNTKLDNIMIFLNCQLYFMVKLLFNIMIVTHEFHLACHNTKLDNIMIFLNCQLYFMVKLLFNIMIVTHEFHLACHNTILDNIMIFFKKSTVVFFFVKEQRNTLIPTKTCNRYLLVSSHSLYRKYHNYENIFA